MMRKIAVLLCDIRSTHNVGSIFRTADGAGVCKVYLAGVTPAPRDRFGRARKDIAKTALGAETYVPWEQCSSALSVIKKLRTEGWQIVAIEQDPRSVSYRAVSMSKPTLFILGSEVDGLPKKILDACDVIAEIPMRGKKESLNVSVAAGIMLYASVR